MIRYLTIACFFVSILSGATENTKTITQNVEDDVSDPTIVSAFQKFIKDFDKAYRSIDEINSKYQIFKANYIAHKALQKKYEGRNDKHQVGITKFMDMKPEHFKLEYRTAVISPEELKAAAVEGKSSKTNSTATHNAIKAGAVQDPSTANPPTLKALPDSFDWRDEGVVTKVKNQGRCGSCYAHSTTGILESQYAIKYGALKSFSEEQIISCSYSNDGCVGGNQELAFQYLIRAGGIMSYASWPYTATVQTCQFDASQVEAQVADYFFAGQNEDTIKRYVYTNGPIGAIFNANMLQYYTSGIINSSHATCDPLALDHAVLIVGWGTSPSGLDYWIVKNSYGANWGENGYFRISRGKGTCGINQYVIGATLA
jgi:cathepsin F